jgi:hypothetical protein
MSPTSTASYRLANFGKVAYLYHYLTTVIQRSYGQVGLKNKRVIRAFYKTCCWGCDKGPAFFSTSNIFAIILIFRLLLVSIAIVIYSLQLL